MKKKFYFTILTVAAVISTTMCSKKAELPDTPGVKEPDIIEATVEPQQEKVSFTQATGQLTLKWEEGDVIMVNNGTTQEQYTVVPGSIDATGKKASFSGEKMTGSKFDIYYPGDTYASQEALMERLYTGQVQDENGSTAHLEFNALIKGASDYHTVVFSKSGDNKLNGVLKLVVKMPNEVTEVSSISLATADNIFYTTNKADGGTTNTLSLSFTKGTQVDEDHNLTAYIMTSMVDVTIPAGTKFAITVNVPDIQTYFQKTMSHSSDISINGGQTLNLDISTATVMTRKLAGEGTSASPYQIWTKEDMQLVKTYLPKKNSTSDATYFTLMQNVDMGDEEFEPIVNGTTLYKIDFSSHDAAKGRKTLSNVKISNDVKYASIFGALNGSVHDVNFDNIHTTVSGAKEYSACICGYLGGVNAGIVGTVENVKLTNSSVAHTQNTDSDPTAAGNRNHAVGIVCGNFARGKIDSVVVESSCTTSLKITAALDQTGEKQYYAALGGIAGFTSQNLSSTDYFIKNCICKAVVDLQSTAAPATADQIYYGCGGIIGMVKSSGITVNGCTFGGTINPSSINVYHFGGIVGYDNKDSDGLSIQSCTCSSDADLSALKHHYSAGILGKSAGTNLKITGCKNYASLDVTSKSRNYCCGIVGQVGDNATISGCENHVTIKGNGYCSGIVGCIGDSAVVKSCYNYAEVTGSANYCSGIVGYMTTTPTTVENPFYDNHNTGAVTGNDFTGGIIGHCNGKAEISSCDNNAAINGGASVGGIVGRIADGSKITGCTNESNGTITTSGGNVGGIAGYTFGVTIEGCHNKASISVPETKNNTGGIIGLGDGVVKLSNSTNEGAISGYSGVAGIVGGISVNGAGSEISNCENKAVGTITPTSQKAGGIVGTVPQISIKNCTNKASISAAALNYIGGIIGYCSGFAIISECVNEASISGNTSVGGIAGAIASDGSEISLCKNNSQGTITLGTSNAGGIIGLSAKATITKCYNKANVGTKTSTITNVGGIVGSTNAKTQVSQCFNTGTIKGNSNIGGIVGIFALSVQGEEGYVENCYSKGNITVGKQYAGGIVGYLYGYNDVKSCYATGTFGTQRGIGTIVGRALSSTSGTNNNKIQYVVAWPTSFSGGGTSSQFSSGAIGGYCSPYNEYTKCWRRYEATGIYTISSNPTGKPSICDQGHTHTAANPVTEGIGGGSAWYPYHGDAAQDGSGNYYTSVNDVVTNLINAGGATNWDTNIWKLDNSDGFPTLKNNPESN